MRFKKSDVKFETMRGKGPGGQHRNKTDSCVRATHLPTGISVTIDGRDQSKNKRMAVRELERRLKDFAREKRAASRKSRRDEAIKPSRAIRTYDFKSGVVTDHRSGKRASVKDVVGKGKVFLVQPDHPDHFTFQKPK